jgi:hypothetical protein
LKIDFHFIFSQSTNQNNTKSNERCCWGWCCDGQLGIGDDVIERGSMNTPQQFKEGTQLKLKHIESGFFHFHFSHLIFQFQF